ncbi:MAG TPA: menaquinone biosynthesis protein [Bryobacteraceae bacterium]|nr:menaquinone biosynthesis protein [Bryobacteraceae bacterium]
MLNCYLTPENAALPHATTSPLRVCAVSYLNTLPLVWGMLRGPQKGIFDLSFSVPAECANRLSDGRAQIGIVPCAEIPRLGLDILPGTGIASDGPVRSILLISKVPFSQIRQLAVDSSSRTSVILARIVLSRKYGAEPALTKMPPDLPSMLEAADAALIIGDPALHLDPLSIPFYTLDLGAEWTEMTGLPMVFAVWAGKRAVLTPDVADAFSASCDFGMDRIDDIARECGPARGFQEALVRQYLRQNIVFRLQERHYKGMRLFLEYAGSLSTAETVGNATV